MREPIARDVEPEPQPQPGPQDAPPASPPHAPEPAIPAPAPTLNPRRLTEPDAKFIADLAMAIRAGARPETGAR